jgi:hypothetical protein
MATGRSDELLRELIQLMQAVKALLEDLVAVTKDKGK